MTQLARDYKKFCFNPCFNGSMYKNTLERWIRCHINLPKLTVFIHRSIKTRIETGHSDGKSPFGFLFLYIDPLKQGLKQPECKKDANMPVIVFIHRSIKTRIETEQW